MNEDGMMICRAIRPTTKTWITIRIPPMHLTATPEEAVQYVLDEFKCQFIPMEFKWVDGLTKGEETNGQSNKKM